MWTSIALAVGLLNAVPGQAAEPKLKLTNARITYGFLGRERTDTKFLPGDLFFLAFDIVDAKVDPRTGKVFYGMKMELVDSNNKLVFKQDNPNTEVLNTLGGARLPSFAQVVIGLDQPPGKYTLRVTVTDRISKDRKELSRNFEVLKRGFGIVRLTAPCVGFTGQSFMAHFGVVGFRKGTDKVPKVSVRMNILDENSKATLTKPFTVEIPKDLPEEAKAEDLTVLPMQFPFPLNRPGTFTIQLEATDQISKETVKQSYKITVLDPKKYETGK